MLVLELKSDTKIKYDIKVVLKIKLDEKNKFTNCVNLKYDF